MDETETVVKSGKTLAIIFRSGLRVESLRFFTNEDNPLQVGFHDQKKGTKLTPHVHKITKPLKINKIQEVLYVEMGRIRISFYDRDGLVIARKILQTKDSVLLISGGHGVEFLKDSRIFMVKQGPYSNTVHSKIYIKAHHK